MSDLERLKELTARLKHGKHDQSTHGRKRGGGGGGGAASGGGNQKRLTSSEHDTVQEYIDIRNELEAELRDAKKRGASKEELKRLQQGVDDMNKQANTEQEQQERVARGENVWGGTTPAPAPKKPKKDAETERLETTRLARSKYPEVQEYIRDRNNAERKLAAARKRNNPAKIAEYEQQVRFWNYQVNLEQRSQSASDGR